MHGESIILRLRFLFLIMAVSELVAYKCELKTNVETDTSEFGSASLKEKRVSQKSSFIVLPLNPPWALTEL